MQNILYPKLRWRWLPVMLGYCALGALIAGAYGIIHDQITYTLSPEYFTRLKFAQFHYADFGLPPRIFVGEIGFLATWWVGFFAAWFLSRMAVPTLPPEVVLRQILRGFLIILLNAGLASILGYVYGLVRAPISNASRWAEMATSLGVVDLQHFVRVAYIHNASYLGGLIGLVVAITDFWIRHRIKIVH